MTEKQNSKRFDLEERTFQFAKKTGFYVKQLPKNISNLEYGRQVVDSSGSVGANYIEANEALSKKDFTMRTKNMPERS
jgi:four helix bundle protein